MPEADEKRQDSGQSKGGGGGGGAPRPVRKPWNDSTNIIGFLVWLMSSIVTSIALMLMFVGLPSECTGDRGQIISWACAAYIVRLPPMWFVFGTAVIMQFLLSALIWRVQNMLIRRIGYGIEAFVNMIGLYWLFCIQGGLWSGVYVAVSALLANPVSALIGTTVIVGLSLGWPYLEKALFNAPRTGGAAAPGGAQRR